MSESPLVTFADLSEEDRRLFRESVGPVRPVDDDRIEPERLRRKAPARMRRREIDVSAAHFPDIPLLTAGDVISHLAPGMQKKVLRRLRGGDFEMDAEVDLHGLTVDEAMRRLENFLRACVADGDRCVHVIHGKGYRSEGDYPVLKNRVNLWLRAHPDVLAFCTARPADGGTGALYALLRKARERLCPRAP
jgi:DNA-nicking Smr family endonuclease